MMRLKLLNGFTLKMIGIMTMTIDHIGHMLYPDQLWMRIVGRAAFPIFAFLIAEGFSHSKNVYKYLLRLSVFAIVLELAFLAIRLITNSSGLPSNTPLNIFVTLALGLSLLIVLKKGRWYLLFIPVVLLITMLFPVDYGVYGLLVIVLMYYLKDYLLVLGLSVLNIGFFYIDKLELEIIDVLEYGLDYWTYQAASMYALVFILLYSGKQGYKLKYFFYLYYPAHLVAIYLVGEYLLN